MIFAGPVSPIWYHIFIQADYFAYEELKEDYLTIHFLI